MVNVVSHDQIEHQGAVHDVLGGISIMGSNQTRDTKINSLN